jgi:hypothetical protein
MVYKETMTKPEFDESDLPPVDPYDKSKLDLGIGAWENGRTPSEEFIQRMEDKGLLVVSDGIPKLPLWRKVVNKIKQTRA